MPLILENFFQPIVFLYVFHGDCYSRCHISWTRPYYSYGFRIFIHSSSDSSSKRNRGNFLSVPRDRRLDLERPFHGGFVIWTGVYFPGRITTNIRLFFVWPSRRNNSYAVLETSTSRSFRWIAYGGQLSGFSKRDWPGTRGHLVAWRGISAVPTNGPFYPIGKRPTPGGTKCNQYKHTIKPSYSAGNEPDWNDTWWRNTSLTKAPMNPRPIGDRKIGVKKLMVAKGKKSYLVHI